MRDRPLPVAGFKGTPEEIERQWHDEVYRGRGDSMAQLTWRAVLIGSCLGGVLSLTNLYIGLKAGWGFGVAVQMQRTGAANVGSYGWDGGLGSSWLNDPAEELTGVLLTNQMWSSPRRPAVCDDFWTCAYAAGGVAIVLRRFATERVARLLAKAIVPVAALVVLQAILVP